MLLGGRTDELDLRAVSRVAAVVRGVVLDGMVEGVHDVADGGLATCIGEMVARSGIGARLSDVDADALFAESAGRVLVCATSRGRSEIRRRCLDAGVPLAELGEAGGDRLVVDGLVDVAVVDVVSTYRDRLPNAMAAGALHE